MAGNHATGTAGVLGSSELNRDTAGLQGTFGWAVQSGAVTFSTGLTFNVAAIATADYKVAGVNGASYAGGSVVLTTQDATNPRVDIIVITVAGSVSAVAGTPAALTSTGGPGPATPTAAQLEIARIYVPASGGLLSASSITDRRVALPDGAVTLTTTGDVIYASAAHTPARLGIGSTSQVLTVTAGVPSWATPSTTGSTVPTTTTGQILFASATNVLSALAVGTAYQALAMNSGATLPTWQASPTSVLIAQGDILYATAANTLARLPKGTAGQALVMNSGATAPEWGSVSAILKVSASGLAALPDRSASLLVQVSSSANTYGSYMQFRAATGNAIYLLHLICGPQNNVGNSGYGQYTVGTGGAASETAVSQISVPGAGASSPVNALDNVIWPWIAVAASTRIALKAADSNGSSNGWYTRLNVIDQADVVYG